MGNSSYQTSTLPKYEWNWIGNHTGIDLFKRQSDALIAERRTITLDNRFALETELQIYEFRSNNNYGLVRVYQVDGVEAEKKKQGKSSLCACSESKVLNVYSQRIEHRLSDLPQLTFPQSLHLLRETLNSFHQVYQKFGPLHVNSQLIGISNQNKARVWVNQNWALNHPSHKIPILLTINNLHLPPQLRDEREMVTNIVQVVQQKTEQGKFPIQFGEGIYANSVNFREAKRFLAKYINEDFQDYIPAIIKRSTVLASQRQISQYNSSVSPAVSAPFMENNNVKIVQSMYQQFNKGSTNEPLETKVSSSPFVLTRNNNVAAINTLQSFILNNNAFSSTQQQRNVQSFPILTNTVLHFQNENTVKHLQTQPNTTTVFPPSLNQNVVFSPNLQNNQHFNQRVINQTNPLSNFGYLKFKLIQDGTTPQTVHHQPQISELQSANQTKNVQFSAQNHFAKIRSLPNTELSESSEHKASYKILQTRKEGQVPRVR